MKRNADIISLARARLSEVWHLRGVVSRTQPGRLSICDAIEQCYMSALRELIWGSDLAAVAIACETADELVRTLKLPVQ